MNPHEIKDLADAIAQNNWHPSTMSLLIAALVVGLSTFFGSYVAEKAKNTATKEDVADITRTIEAVRADYTAKLEGLKGNYQLRIAALDRRLEVHQKAFSMWRRLIFSVFNPEIGAVCSECEDWWTNNCVYLAPEARDAFITAVTVAHSHHELSRSRLPVERIEANWQKILDAGNAIMRGADLPALPSEIISTLPTASGPTSS